jgi:magnesium transporter
MQRELLEQLKTWIAAGDRAALATAFQQLHPADAAELLAELEPSGVARYLEIMGIGDALTVFEFVPFEVQKEALEHLPRETLTELITQMRPDERADLVEELDEPFKEQVLSRLIKAERQNILKLLTYPEDSAGAYMTTDYAELRPHQDVRAAMTQLRLQAFTKETIYYAYVVDNSKKLIGIISLRDIIMARPENLVAEVMHKNVISVRVDTDIEDVSKEMVHYDFLAMPVVDAEGRLVGIVTYDDVFDIMAEEATEDMYLLANLDTDEKLSSPLFRSVKLRVPWLMVNLCTAGIASYTVTLFSHTIGSFVVLASLMPIVAGIGGNAGTQSLTVVVRALALGEIKVRGNWRVLLKESGVGLCSGLICGMVMAVVAYAWHHNLLLSLLLWLAMVLNMIVAATLGALVPITLRKLNLDPALGSSIFLTAATDTGGYFILLGLATLLLQALLRHG